MAKTHSAPPDAAAGPSVADRILNTACELFYREGVRAVGIQRVIDEAGIAKASLYAHYASKDDLVAAFLSRQADTWRTAVESRLADPSLDAHARLLLIFDLQAERIANPVFRGCPFQNTGSEIADAAHPARIVAAAYRRWLQDLFTSLVREAGIDDVELVAGALIVLHDGAAASAYASGDPAAAQHARWAAERLLEAHAPARRSSRRKRR